MNFDKRELCVRNKLIFPKQEFTEEGWALQPLCGSRTTMGLCGPLGVRTRPLALQLSSLLLDHRYASDGKENRRLQAMSKLQRHATQAGFQVNLLLFPGTCL